MELFFVTVAILLFAGCQNSIMNTLQKHIVGTLFKEIASHDILLRGGAVVFLLLCLVVFSRHLYHRYHYSSKQYFWVALSRRSILSFVFFLLIVHNQPAGIGILSRFLNIGVISNILTYGFWFPLGWGSCVYVVC
jgi:hypothetical protein